MRLHVTEIEPSILQNNEIETIIEKSEQLLQFNVMPGKNVTEKLIFEKYIVSRKKIQAFFSREYKTEMAKSPDHFIFLSALINLQKIIYILMCKHFGVEYNSNRSEKFKIWPIKTDVQINGMIRKTKDIIQDFEIISIQEIAQNKYMLKGVSSSESSIIIKGSAIIYKI